MKKRKFLWFILIVALVLVSVVIFSFPSEAPTIPPETSVSTTLEETTILETTKPLEKEITISFLGDCMMASYKGQSISGNMNWCLDNKDFSYFFEKAMPFISDDDFTIANCENVFTDTATAEVKKNHNPAYWYRSSSKNAGVFSANSIDVVSLSNNHVNDYGSTGKKDTIKALENGGVLWGNDDNIVFLEKDGITIGVLCVNFWGSYNIDNIVSKIASIKDKTDIQIVYFHGGTERIHSPEQWKINGCHKFIDNGADLVVGSHPHVLQPYEEYNGVSIVYSLGNFCYGGSKSPENRTVILEQTFILDEDNNLLSSSEKLIPFYVYSAETNNWKPAPIENKEEKTAVLDFMYGRKSSPF